MNSTCLVARDTPGVKRGGTATSHSSPWYSTRDQEPTGASRAMHRTVLMDTWPGSSESPERWVEAHEPGATAVRRTGRGISGEYTLERRLSLFGLNVWMNRSTR